MNSPSTGSGTALTRSDAHTMLAFLSHADAAESDRIQRTEVSRTAYHDSRRHLYGARWIQDRYVPSPAWLGYPRLGFGLSRPLADRAEEYLRLVASFPGTVTLWATPGCVFGTFFFHPGGEADRLAKTWSDPELVSDSTLVQADPMNGEIPAYFDYEGLWAHLCGRMGTAGYPRGTPIGGAAGSVPSRELARDLLEEVGTRTQGTEPVYLHRTIGLRRSQQVLFEKGCLSRRIVLGPGPIPSFEGRDINRLLFVTGSAPSNFSPGELLKTLVQTGRVFPYLLAGGSGNCIVGFLGQAEPPPPTAGENASSFSTRLLPALRSQLSDIKVFQGEVATLAPWLHHQYERLLPSVSGKRLA